MPHLETLLQWTQVAILCPLAILGLHRGWMVVLYLRHRGDEPVLPASGARGELPFVTVQLPIYNERFVAPRLIEAAASLDYPADRLEIQVLDDSTDDTPELVARCVGRLRGPVAIHHLRRGDRRHFKAGALAHGLRTARGELVAVFDADFVPPRDFLRATVPVFDDPEVGLVQSRWEHLNPDQSLLTRVQALLLDGHFAVEHVARSRSGCFFNFNGTAGIFRRRCIDDAGGWQGDTLTEDMDLSYRAQLGGWRFVYRPELACPAELPVDMNAFVIQQHRWAKGSIQTARKLLRRTFRAPIPVGAKLEAAFHLLGNLAFPLLLALILVAMPLQALRLANGTDAAAWPLRAEGLALVLSTLCVLLYYGVSQLGLRRAGPGAGIGTWLHIPLVLSVGAGLCVSNSLAVIGGLFGRVGEFRRTPKFATAPGTGRRALTAMYRSRRGPVPLLEIGLGLWAATTTVLAAALGLAMTSAFHALFAFGLLWIGTSSLLPAARVRAEPTSATA